jgi:ketosteroid isomerase-like protein
MNHIEDEMAIRALVARYADGVNRYDAKTWESTWAPQGEWILRQGDPRVGREAIVAFWDSVMASLKFAIMIPGSAEISIQGQQATGRWYMTEVVEEKQGQGAHIVGVYNDHYLKIDQQWYFQSRQYHMLYENPTNPEAVYQPLPAQQLISL